MTNKTVLLLAGVKELPETIIFKTYFDKETCRNHPGMDPNIERTEPTAYIKEETEDGKTWYTNKKTGKDAFYFEESQFGTLLILLDCDKGNLGHEDDLYSVAGVVATGVAEIKYMYNI